MRFHITPAGPAPCTAEKRPCPYGGESGLENHFDSLADAYRYFEEQMTRDGKPVLESLGAAALTTRRAIRLATQPPNKLCDERIEYILELHDELREKALIQKQLLEHLQARNAILTEEEFSSREAAVEAITSHLREQGVETKNLYSTDGVYTPERRALHSKILKHFINKYKGIANGGEAVIAGGLAGAGKSTALEWRIGKYAVINPDDVKEYMAERGLMPRITGLSPMEASTLVHEEASDISQALLRTFIAQKKNVMLDVTLGGLSSARRKIEMLSREGYKIEGNFVDITLEVSEERGRARYRRSMNEYIRGANSIGGRPVPVGVNHPSTRQQNSANADNFIALCRSGVFSKIVVYDNSGTAPAMVDFGQFAKD